MSSFFTELKRRNVFRVGVAYVITAWLVAQVADLALESFGTPDWVMKTVLLLLVVGFPLALVFAWAFEKTPEGIKLEKNVDRSQSITHVTGKKLDRSIIVVLAVAVVVLMYREMSVPDGPPAVAGSQSIQGQGTGTPPVPADDKSIAVLPFANMSSDPEQDYFASGIHEDILTYLSRVSDLRVISRTSVLKYTGQEHDVRAIARELGVNHILEGSVRKSGNRVRVTAQLIDAVDDEHMWAENYDRDLTDVFAIQSELARQIVAALEARLTPDEAALISARPTQSVAAYQMYLRAREIMNRPEYSTQKYREAEPLTRAAIDEDPGFALAHLQLADIYAQYYWRGEKTDRRRESIRLQIDEASRLAPELPEVQVALAEYYYRVMGDWERAVEALDRVAGQLPNNADVQVRRGYALRRLGRWDESIAAFQRAWALEPANQDTARGLQATLAFARRWDESLAVAEQLMDRGDAEPMVEVMWAWTRISHLGDLDAARQVLARIPAVADAAYWSLKLFLPWSERDYRAALLAAEDPAFAEFWRQDNADGYPDLLRGMFLLRLGEADAARQRFEAAAASLRDRLETDPQGELLAPLAIVEAYLGRREAAMAAIARAREAFPESRDRLASVDARRSIAWALVVLGEHAQALDELEYLLQVPNGSTPWDLVLDPVFDPLRDEPRFKQMVSEAVAR